MDDQAVGHLGYVLDHRVELGCSHPHPTTVQCCVRAAGDDAATPFGNRDPVSVAPDTRETLVIGGPQTAAVVIAPQRHRHRGHRRGDDELSLLADHVAAVGIKGADVGSEPPAGDLPRPHFDDWAPADKRSADIGPATDR